MNTLFGSLSICLGFYFAIFSGRALVLQSMGYSPLIRALDFFVMCSPFASILILLVVGFLTIPEKANAEFGAILAKVSLSLFVAVIPLAVHLTMIKLTYDSNPQPSKLYGPLSASEWFALLLGCLLIGLGIFLLARKCHKRLAH